MVFLTACAIGAIQAEFAFNIRHLFQVSKTLVLVTGTQAYAALVQSIINFCVDNGGGGVKVPPGHSFRCHFVTVGVNGNALLTFSEKMVKSEQI